nr:type II CAAX endopeptidase family protein [uncultured Psychroserpens sp.]
MTSNLAHLLKTNTLAKVAELLTLFLLGILFVMLFESGKKENLIYNQLILWAANIFMLIYIYAGIKIRGEKLDSLGFSFKKFNIQFAFKTVFQSIIVFIITLLFFGIGSIIMANITGVPESADMGTYSFLKDNFWVLIMTLLGAYIASSLGEEVIYRGFLLNRLSELGVSKHLTIFISAVIFGLIHYSWGPMGIVQTGLMGLALGYSYYYFKKKIWIVILAHMYMDSLLFLNIYTS